MKKFKESVQKMLIVFVSREFAFLFVIFGVAAQVIHTYYLAFNISSLGGNIKIVQAVMLSTFISVSLLYFVSVSDDGKSKQSQNTRMAVNLFMVIEILINLYYYSRHLVLLPYDNGTGGISINNWFDFGFGVLLAAMIPVTIKLYASHIRAKEWIADMEAEKNKDIVDNPTEFDERLNIIEQNILNLSDNLDNKITIFNEGLDNKIVGIDETIKQSFDKHSSLFLNQYKNKIETLEKNK